MGKKEEKLQKNWKFRMKYSKIIEIKHENAFMRMPVQGLEGCRKRGEKGWVWVKNAQNFAMEDFILNI